MKSFKKFCISLKVLKVFHKLKGGGVGKGLRVEGTKKGGGEGGEGGECEGGRCGKEGRG